MGKGRGKGDGRGGLEGIGEKEEEGRKGKIEGGSRI